MSISACFCRTAAVLAVFAAAACASARAGDRPTPQPQKYVIGATALLTESASGLPFAARIDTGAESCSIHVEKVEIKSEKRKPLANVGKTIRFLLKNERGKSAWGEATIADVVRVRSSTLKNGEYDRRYKVKMTLVWREVHKDVLVTLNDRTEMDYPLLVGRDFLQGDFLVNVDLDSRE